MRLGEIEESREAQRLITFSTVSGQEALSEAHGSGVLIFFW